MSAHIQQGSSHHAEIQNQVLRLPIAGGAGQNPLPHQEDRLPPWLLLIDGNFLLGFGSGQSTPFRKPLFQFSGNAVVFPGERQMGSQPLQSGRDQLYRGIAVQLQALSCNFRRHQRMTIPIPPDPRSKAEDRPHGGMNGATRTEAGNLPRIPQSPVRLRDGSRHRAGQTVDHPFPLHVDGRPLRPHLLRSPPALQNRLKMITSLPVRAVFS